jgi:hypothetical protein
VQIKGGIKPSRQMLASIDAKGAQMAKSKLLRVISKPAPVKNDDLQTCAPPKGEHVRVKNQ